jgi:hypothetical protein
MILPNFCGFFSFFGEISLFLNEFITEYSLFGIIFSKWRKFTTKKLIIIKIKISKIVDLLHTREKRNPQILPNKIK